MQDIYLGLTYSTKPNSARVGLQGFNMEAEFAAKIAYCLVRDMVCEKVLFVGKTRSQISHHQKDGVIGAWIESIVMHTPDTKRKYLKNG
ncbi:MAG: hypothetical protein ACE5KE_15480 [Methanosarcinales archaeon]